MTEEFNEARARAETIAALKRAAMTVSVNSDLLADILRTRFGAPGEHEAMRMLKMMQMLLGILAAHVRDDDIRDAATVVRDSGAVH